MDFKKFLLICVILCSLPTASAYIKWTDYNIFWDENFDNGNYTNPNLWTVGAGTWSATTLELVGTQVNGYISTPNDYNLLSQKIHASAAIEDGTVEAVYQFCADGNNVADNNGYMIRYAPGANFELTRMSNGSFAGGRMLGLGVMTYSQFADVNIHIKVESNGDNNFLVWVDGAYIGSAIDNNKHDCDYSMAWQRGSGQDANFDNLMYYDLLSDVVAIWSHAPAPILDPENGVTNVTVNFVDSSFSDDNVIDTWAWRIDGNLFSTDQNSSRDFNELTDFNVSLYVEDGLGNFDQEDKNIHVSQMPQDVNFIYLPTLISEGDDVNFFGSATDNGVITNYYWEFGSDGNHATTTDANVTHNFANSGTEQVCLTVQDDEDLNRTICHSVDILGPLDIWVWDENGGIPIQGATVSFNGSNYTTDVNGNVNISIIGLTAGEYTIQVDVNSEYPVRQFVYYMTQSSGMDLNLLMLRTSFGMSRSFQFYQEDKNTLIPNSFVEWNRTDAVQNGIAQRIKTNSGGIQGFFGQEDANYFLDINDTVAGFERHYSRSIVITKKPLDISDATISFATFNLEISELAAESLSGLTTDANFPIYTNTEEHYLFTVDTNTAYYPTEILIQERGDSNVFSWQPYVVSKDTDIGIETTIYTIDNEEGRISLPGIKIESYTVIGGVSTLVESKYSDSTGVALFHFELGRKYTLYFYDGNTLKITAEIVASSPNLFAYINTGTFETPEKISGVQIEWYSASNLIPDGNNFVEIRQTLMPYAATIGVVEITVSQNGTVIFTDILNVASSGTSTISYDVNVEGLDTVYPLRVDLNVFNDSNGSLTSAFGTYTFLAATWFRDTVEYLEEGLGQLAGTTIILFSGLILTRKLRKRRPENLEDNWLIVPMGILTFFGTVIGLIPFNVWALGTAFGIIIAGWRIKD